MGINTEKTVNDGSQRANLANNKKDVRLGGRVGPVVKSVGGLVNVVENAGRPGKSNLGKGLWVRTARGKKEKRIHGPGRAGKK